MSAAKVKTNPFDPAEYLDTPKAIAVYITEALETGDPAFVADVDAVNHLYRKTKALGIHLGE